MPIEETRRIRKEIACCPACIDMFEDARPAEEFIAKANFALEFGEVSPVAAQLLDKLARMSTLPPD